MNSNSKIKVKDRDLTDLKKYFGKQTLAIPELQRNFVWTKDKIPDLIHTHF